MHGQTRFKLHVFFKVRVCYERFLRQTKNKPHRGPDEDSTLLGLGLRSSLKMKTLGSFETSVII